MKPILRLFLGGLCLAFPRILPADITYVEAVSGPGGNTTLADGSTFTPPLNGTTGADNNWEQRTVFGSGGSIFESGGENVAENAPELRTKITGLLPGVDYSVRVYFWDPGSTVEDWNIRAGFTSNPGANTLFTAADATGELGATAAVAASTLVHAAAPTVFTESSRVLLAAPVGVATADANGEIAVFIDDLPAPTNVNVRTWYDGVGVERSDTDGDGLPDAWEIANGTDPAVDDDAEDPDGDDLTNLQEFQNNGHPFIDDTDGDGVKDGVEFADGTLVNGTDTDGDFYSDGVEKNRLTNPLDAGDFPSPEGGLKVDFSSTNEIGQAGVFHHSDWFTYIATHELIGVTDRTETWNVPAFGGAAVDFTVAYPDTTANTVRQMIGRTDLQTAAYTGAESELVRDWIGIDPRAASGGNGTGADTSMTFTFSGLPAGTYRYRAYHHDVEFQSGRFGLKVTDATRTAADLGFFRVTHSGQNGNHLPENPPATDPAELTSTIELIFVSNGIDPVVITYTGRETASVFTSFVAVNGIEVTADTDSDGDFIPDPADLHAGLDDGTLDDDSDGLSNLREYHLGTDPAVADTDGDGLTDAAETDSGTFTGLADSGTSPFLADTDGDGADDGAEAAAGSDPFDPASLPSTGPIRVISTSLNPATNEFTIQWESVPGATYDIVYSDTLTGSPDTWPLAADDVPSPGSTALHTISLGSPRPLKRFFVVIGN